MRFRVTNVRFQITNVSFQPTNVSFQRHTAKEHIGRFHRLPIPRIRGLRWIFSCFATDGVSPNRQADLRIVLSWPVTGNMIVTNELAILEPSIPIPYRPMRQREIGWSRAGLSVGPGCSDRPAGIHCGQWIPDWLVSSVVRRPSSRPFWTASQRSANALYSASPSKSG